jgi:hypothetical protein
LFVTPQLTDDVTVGQVYHSDGAVCTSDGDEVGSRCDSESGDTAFAFCRKVTVPGGGVGSELEEWGGLTWVPDAEGLIGGGGDEEFAGRSEETGRARFSVGVEDLHGVAGGYCM